MIVKQVKPSDEWEMLPLRYVTTPFETMHAATQLEIEVVGCDETDLEAFISSAERFKRKRKMKDQRYPGESNSESGCSDADYLSDPPTPVKYQGGSSQSHGSSLASVSKSGLVSMTVEPRPGSKKPGLAENKMASTSDLPQKAGKRSMLPVLSIPKNPGLNQKAGKGSMLSVVHTSRNPGLTPKEAKRFTMTSSTSTTTSTSGLPQMAAKERMAPVASTKKGIGSQLLNQKSAKGLHFMAPANISQDRHNEYNFKRFEARVMTELQEIKEGIQALALKLDSLPAREEDGGDMQLLHKLPFTNLEDMSDFQQTVDTNFKYRSFMVQYLRSRCSNALYRSTGQTFSPSLNKTVNDVCAILMTNALSRLFCMTGRSSQKIPFEAKYPQIIDLIFDAVKQKQVNGIPLDMVSVKRSIGEWFRLSRVRGRPKSAVAASQRESVEQIDCDEIFLK